ncbi:MAG: DUF2059 domain-containing protein [Cyanobacteria bacterium P01_A01_bin.135]
MKLAASLLATAILFTGALHPASAQTAPAEASPAPISERKRALIAQLLEITGGRQQHEQIQQAMFTQMQQQMQQTIGQLLRPSGESASSEAIAANLDSFMTQFSAAIQTEITYDDYLEQVYYPVYDQYLSEADLEGLIAFYETPVGQKLVSVQPQIFQASMQRTSEAFMPQMIAIANQILQQLMTPSEN